MIQCRAAVAAFSVAAVLCPAQPLHDNNPNLHWEGTLRGPVQMSIEAWTAEVHASTPDAVGLYRYRMSLPLSDGLDQDVRLRVLKGDRIQIAQQTRKENQHTAIVKIDVSNPTHVSFDLLYNLYPHSWSDAPNDWWAARDVVRWRGHGRGRATLICRQSHCEETHEGSPDAMIDRFDFDLSLPTETSVVTPTDVRVPGEINIAEQPSKANNYAVRLSMNLREPADYAFTMTWSTVSGQKN